MKIIEEEIRKEIENEDYTNNIKKHCSWCERKIPGTIKYYTINGNACQKCLKIFNINVIKRKTEKNKTKKHIFIKI